ncbi:Chitinase 2 [Dispira simplex]|nr:Chitinase 2 [Dispira simplex]
MRVLTVFAGLGAVLLNHAVHVIANENLSQCGHNLAVYWGQNPWGGQHLEDSANWEQNIDYYCHDDSIDTLLVSFLINYNLGGLPELNLANHCNTTYANTKVHHCPDIAKGIKYCQSRGKKVLLSLGGAEGRYGFQDDQGAIKFAQLLWDMFLGGKHDLRPFDDAVLDGIDLDLEHGGPTGVTAFVGELRRLYGQDRNKSYLISAAPQCEFPDSNLGKPLEEAWFDMVFIQFYNNWCGLVNFDNIWAWNYGTWHNLTKRMVNKNTKLYLGAPASTGAGRGYVDFDRLTHIYKNVSSQYDSLGGIMLWDTSNAWQNTHFQGGNGRTNFANAVGQWLHQQRQC